MIKRSSLVALSMVFIGCAVTPEGGPTAPQNPVALSKEGVSQTDKAPLLRDITFHVQVPPAYFKVAQVATAQFVKLTVTNGSQVIFASDSDEVTGFLAAPGTDSFAIGAQVPDGNNWVASLGFYTTQDSPPFLELKTAFHVPADIIELNMRTHLMGDIVDALQALDASVLDSALELNAYQAFVDALTGFSFDGDSFDFSRLTSLTPPNPTAISGAPIAVDIFNGDLTPSQGSGETASPADYLPLPQHLGNYDSVINLNLTPPDNIGDPDMAGSEGLKSLALQPSNGRLFTHFNADNGDNDLTEKFYGLTPSSSHPVLTESFDPVTVGNITSSNMVLGQANPSGSSPVNALYYFDVDRNATSRRGRLNAVSQSDGSLLWSHNFGDTFFGTSRPNFVPIVKTDNKSTGATSDDEDIVFIGLQTETNDHSSAIGIYALQQTHPDDGSGTELWFYDTGSDLPFNGALSSDQNTLYITTGSPGGGKLLTLNANPDGDTGELINSTALAGTTGTTPAIGSDGTVYVVSSSSILGYLYAFNADGTEKWVKTLPQRSFVPPIVDRQNGQDVIYVALQENPGSLSKKSLMAYNADQTAKWTAPFDYGDSLIFNTSPLVGEEVDGSRIIYQGLSDGNIYAVRDKGSSGSLEWKQSPGGSVVAVELQLNDGVLYSGTFNGGDGQFIGLQALKVSTPDLPADAPWPRVHGDRKNSGNQHSS